MARPQKLPLRTLTDQERQVLQQVARASSERAERVARAKALLSVAEGAQFTTAARRVGFRSGDTVGRWVQDFNSRGLAALDRRHGGGPASAYQATEEERILREFRRLPDREQDGTATWSLSTLQRALRRAPDGLPRVSTWTILRVLQAAGYTWQQSRTWCHTGTARRKRKQPDGATTVVTVTDPKATEKRGGLSGPTG